MTRHDGTIGVGKEIKVGDRYYAHAIALRKGQTLKDVIPYFDAWEAELRKGAGHE